MAITGTEDPMYVTDFDFILQECTSVKTDFDTDAQNEWMQNRLLSGENPDNFARIWAHTHPGPSASPSTTDWETFQEVMGDAAWGVMLILGTGNEFVCVFRCNDQMLNLQVEVESEHIPDSWVTELDNIKKYIPKKQVQIGYQTNWDWQDSGYEIVNSPGTHNYGKAKKKKENGLHVFSSIPHWDRDDVSPSFQRFASAMSILPGSPNFSSAFNYTTTFEDLMSAGPVRCINALKTMYQNVQDGRDDQRFQHLCKVLGKALFDDEEAFFEYNQGYAYWWDPIALFGALRDGEMLESDYEGIDPETKAFLHYDKKQKEWMFSEKVNIVDEIPKMLTSGEPVNREIAQSAMISATVHTPAFITDFDKGFKKVINQFFEEQEEYHQCQKNHEANDTPVTPASSSRTTS